VRRKLGLLLLAVLVVGLAGFAQTPAPVTVADGVLSFYNDTGTSVTKLSITFDKAVTIEKADVVVGEEMATLVALSNTFAFIDILVPPAGTVVVTLKEEDADAVVTASTWFGMGSVETALSPRVATDDVLLFDNETGAEVMKFSIVFSGANTLEASALTSIGGGAVAVSAASEKFALFDVSVLVGGTLQVALPEGVTSADVTAYWIE
jgi:hypothetical protein